MLQNELSEIAVPKMTSLQKHALQHLSTIMQAAGIQDSRLLQGSETQNPQFVLDGELDDGLGQGFRRQFVELECEVLQLGEFGYCR